MHDPEQAAEVAEARRLGGLRRRRESIVAHNYDLAGLSTPTDVLRLLDIAAYETLGLERSIGRSRTLAQIASVAIRLLELTNLEERLQAIEGQSKGVSA